MSDFSSAQEINGYSKSSTGKVHNYKKIETIESIIFFVAMVIFIIIVGAMFFTGKGIFSNYVRPPLKGQNGSAVPLGLEDGTTPQNSNVAAGNGKVALLGSPATMTTDEKNKVKQKVSYEIPQWDNIKNAEAQSSSAGAQNTGITGVSSELLAFF